MTPRDLLQQVEKMSFEEIQEALRQNERERKILLKLVQTKRLQQTQRKSTEVSA